MGRNGNTCACGPKSSSVFLSFVESLKEVLQSTPSGGSFVLLGGSDSQAWRFVIWKNAPPDLNPSGLLLLDFCACYRLFIMTGFMAASS